MQPPRVVLCFMAKKYTVKKRKKIKTWLRRAMFFVVLPAYFALLVILGATLFTMMLCNAPANAVEIAGYVCGGIVLIVSIIICFAVIPLCRARQAKDDIKSYDFTPYDATDKEETFESIVPDEKYIFDAAPFDEDSDVTLNSEEAVLNYISQYDPANLISAEQLGLIGDFNPYFSARLKGDGNVWNMLAQKRVKGGKTEVTFSIVYTATFTREGLTVNGKLFPFKDLSAYVDACFTGFANSARVFIVCGEEYLASFAVGGRIAAVLKKFGIALKNQEIFDYILSDPERAFRRIGLRRKLNKVKFTSFAKPKCT